jgi:hypothetical protein
MNSRILSSVLTVVQPVALMFLLSGCLFGENKQYFETDVSGRIPTSVGGIDTNVTPTPSMPTSTPTPTTTPSSSVTPTPTATPIVGATPTPTPSATPVPTATPAPTATATPAPTATPHPTITPSPTPIIVASPTPTPTPRPTATPTPSPTATPSPSPTPVATATPTPVPTATPTPTPVATATPSPTPVATATPSPTPVATATPTPVPTATPTPTPGQGLAPIARNDGPYEIAQNQTLTIAISDLLLNDSDPAGLPLHFYTYQNPTSGTLTLSGNNLVFQPTNNFSGSVTFQYSIANSINLTASATVSIDVRKAATEAIYGQSQSTLYSYDGATGASSAIANFRLSTGGSVSVFDIAIAPSGLMYAVDGSALYYVDASTGIMTKIPTTGLSNFGNINGLTALSDGRLVISGNGIAIYNIATRVLTTLLAPGGYESSGDIIALPDGYLYLSALSSGSDLLIQIDPDTGATRNIGSMGHGGVYGLGYANGTLYGFDSSGLTFSINQTNAHTTNLANTGVSWYGATTNPVLW